MSILFTLPRVFVIDGAGVPRAGAKMFFYEANTLTAQDTYSDDALTVPNTNPVVADSAGHFGAIYLANTPYRVILKDANDVQIWDQDDYNAPLLGLFGSSVLTKNGNYTVSTDDKGSLIRFTATATAALPAVADAGNGFTLAIDNTGTGTVTVNPNSTEQINGANSLAIGPKESAILICDGSAWGAFGHLMTRGSFTGTFTGFSTTPAALFSYEIDRDWVTIWMDDGELGIHTSNATSFTITGIPTAIQTAFNQRIPCEVRDDGKQVPGIAITGSNSGTLTFHVWNGTQFLNSWTASSTKGLSGGWMIRYQLT